MSILDIIIFLFFTGGVVVFGCSFFNKKRSSEEFTSAGRSLPGWVVGMSIFATYVSSISYLAYPGKAYMSDWNAFVFSLSIPIASYFAAKYFVPFYRSIGSVSAYSFLEERFGPWARVYASSCYLLTQVARMGSILYLLALPMNALLGWDIKMIIAVTSVAIIAYSMLGGLKAVIWTEAIQGFILIGGAVVCLCVLMFKMPEGPAQVFQIAVTDQKFSLGSFGSSLTESTFWVCLIYGIFINLQNYGIDQNYVQRYLTAKSDKQAKFSALFGGYLFIPVSAVFFMIGTALYAYYKTFPELLPAGVEGDAVFPYFIVHALPTGLTGLLIASIFAAGMSTVATSITSSATIILTDYYARYINKKPTEKQSVRALYVSNVLIGIIGIFVALAFLNVESALDAWWALSSIFSGGMLGLFLLGYISKKARNVDAVLGVICGIIVVVWMSLSPIFFKDGFMSEYASPFHANLTIVFGTLYGNTDKTFPVYILSGRLLYSFYSSATKAALKSIRSNAAMIKKVYVPKYLYPLSTVIYNYIIFLISLVVLAIVGVILGVKPTIYLLQAPVALIIILILSYGSGMFLATIGVFFRDIEYLWSVALMLIMYTCAIFYYPSKLLKSGWAWILKFNPLYCTIQIFRSAIFGEPMYAPYVIYAAAFSVVITIIGLVCFKKKQDNFILYI